MHCTFQVTRISKHSIERNSKRYGIHGEKRSRDQILNDLSRSRPYTDYSGRERRFLEERRGGGCDPYVYKRKLFLVSTEDRTVVTTYLLPDWFKWDPLAEKKFRRAKADLKAYFDEMELSA